MLSQNLGYSERYEAMLATFGKYAVEVGVDTVYYTAIFGGYDVLKKPKLRDCNQYRFICFTDDDSLGQLNNGWEIVYVKERYKDPRRTAKIFKILSHRFLLGCRLSVWCDGKNELISDVVPYLSDYDDWEIKAFSHPDRDCVYAEARVCIEEEKDKAEVLSVQLERYRIDGLPERNGLLNGSLLARKHASKKVAFAMEKWWEEVDLNSVRDQISLAYVLWKHKIPYSTIRGRSSRLILNHGHRKLTFYDSDGRVWRVRAGLNPFRVLRVRLKAAILKFLF
jgi:hypothetical protein